MSYRILQAFGLKLGAPVLPAGHGFSDQIISLRETVQNNLINRIVEAAQDKKVDLIIFNGNLFDFSYMCLTTIRSVIADLNSIPKIPVIIVPGTTDQLTEFNPYNNTMGKALGISWGSQCYIMNDDFDSPYEIDTLPGLTFTRLNGKKETHSRSGTLPDPEKTNILAYPAAGTVTAAERMNFTEHLQAGYQLILLSGNSDVTRYHDDAGEVKAIDTGDVFRNDFEKNGSGSIAVYEVDENGVNKDSLEFITIDPSKLITIEVDLSPTNDIQGIADAVESQLSELGVTEEDLVWIQYSGNHIDGMLAHIEMKSSLKCKAVYNDVSSVKFKSLNKVSLNTNSFPDISERFQSALELKLKGSEYTDSDKVSLLSLAYRYGISALQGKTPYL